MSYAKVCLCPRLDTENLPHTPRLPVASSGFVPTLHSRFSRITKRVFNMSFDVFIHEQISLSKKTCHRKFARMH